MAKIQQDWLCALYKERSKHSASLWGKKEAVGQASKYSGEDISVTGWGVGSGDRLDLQMEAALLHKPL